MVMKLRLTMAVNNSSITSSSRYIRIGDLCGCRAEVEDSQALMIPGGDRGVAFRAFIELEMRLDVLEPIRCVMRRVKRHPFRALCLLRDDVGSTSDGVAHWEEA
eukprot:CAMPEP_0198220410 /NCGR_PEP_ID=MMETSP1445-20131203/78896_1 /TAXON_ID=36898 /ORGANISM="Pyramimonas sp., Strain CCMP2087" /LENGTH=103 /DNA_ID=CAMNT_0043898177 /DNA_START=275 /DNA_END=585 /DNA_ORIENTATION=-